MNNVYFKDRIDAGNQLAEKLLRYKDKDPVVLALPRGGVVLGKEIANTLDCPLDLIITRKIGHPYSPEYAIGAVGISGARFLNEAEASGINQSWLQGEIDNQIKEAKRRQESYLKGRKPVDLAGKTAILADDGIATGLTMMAAIKEVKSKNPASIVVAVPVIPFETYKTLLKIADDLAVISAPDDFLGSVGAYYQNFPQVEDAEVIEYFGK